ncbi:MAG: CorA family divalent cation transporter [Gemmatimonadales bacterium]|nr:CorA family divalent cation transporter [Gemmatimonadales bacterium]
MIRTILDAEHAGFDWIDVLAPTPEELRALAERFELHPTSVQDCLDPEHLPKYETFGTRTFVIVRASDDGAEPDATTVQELTHKVAIFAGATFLITIHRREHPWLLAFEEQCHFRSAGPRPVVEVRDGLVPQLMLELIGAAIDTYGARLETLEGRIDGFEAVVFGGREFTGDLRDAYVLKRRITLIRRVLWQMLGVVQKLAPGTERVAPLTQDLKEHAESLHSYADELLDEMNNLLGVQLAISSHRTNEVVRVLTLFSVFFLPLTFVTSIYGMNFEHMPEIRSRYGYATVWAVLLLVAGGIYWWFRRRGWLRA